MNLGSWRLFSGSSCLLYGEQSRLEFEEIHFECLPCGSCQRSETGYSAEFPYERPTGSNLLHLISLFPRNIYHVIISFKHVVQVVYQFGHLLSISDDPPYNLIVTNQKTQNSKIKGVGNSSNVFIYHILEIEKKKKKMHRNGFLSNEVFSAANQFTIRFGI